jgi:MOSC domain-containing protein YiiM
MSAIGEVLAVARSSDHRFSKLVVPGIRLLSGIGVEGDCHAGATVKHRSRVKVDPSQPNLRQVHLVHSELFDELATAGFRIAAGAIGENITTRGIDLLGLPTGSRLRLGTEAVVEVTGLRNPCAQLDGFQKGLLRAVIGHDSGGEPVLKAGVMGIVVAGGEVKAGDSILVELPPEPHHRLARV